MKNRTYLIYSETGKTGFYKVLHRHNGTSDPFNTEL